MNELKSVYLYTRFCRARSASPVEILVRAVCRIHVFFLFPGLISKASVAGVSVVGGPLGSLGETLGFLEGPRGALEGPFGTLEGSWGVWRLKSRPGGLNVGLEASF